LVVASFWSNFQLTSANYIEHHGLLRQERAPGKYGSMPFCVELDITDNDG
jgi:hypothetical protein